MQALLSALEIYWNNLKFKLEIADVTVHKKERCRIMATNKLTEQYVEDELAKLEMEYNDIV